MLKKIAITAVAGCLVVVGTGVAMYFVNAAPVPPAISAAEATQAWSEIEKEYSGRVNFLVLDFTDDTPGR